MYEKVHFERVFFCSPGVPKSVALGMSLYVGNIDIQKCNVSKRLGFAYTAGHVILITNAEFFRPGHTPPPEICNELSVLAVVSGAPGPREGWGLGSRPIIEPSAPTVPTHIGSNSRVRIWRNDYNLSLVPG